MEHLFFEVQLCIKISIFKQKHVFDILIILCLMTSLCIVLVYVFLCMRDAEEIAFGGRFFRSDIVSCDVQEADYFKL